MFSFFFFFCGFYSVHLTCFEVVLPTSRIAISPFTLRAPGLLEVPDVTLKIVACGLGDDLLLVSYSLVLFVNLPFDNHLYCPFFFLILFYFYTILYYDTFSIHQHSHCSAYDMQTFSLQYEVKVYEVQVLCN